MQKRPARTALKSVLISVLFCVFPAFAQYAPNRYAVFLADPPVSARFSTREQLRSAAATTYRQLIEAKQRDVLRELASRKIRVTGSVSTLLNAIFVVAPASRLAELQSIPGVIGVRPMRRGKRSLNRATQLVNAPAAWNIVGGQQNAGKGMKIAILDTGIDQTHPAFQGSSLPMPSGFPICTTGHPEDCAYTNNKVIVARSYVRQMAAGTDKSNPAADSTPDDYSPRDRDGHGTAVASCAAANTNSGTVTFTGVAPEAYLGNYKIYGTDGVNDYPPEDVWIQAIEDALKDGMDVANLSSGVPALSGALDTGSTCGIASGMPCDPLALAFENAVKGGLIITVAVGNDGGDASNFPGFNSIESPATAPSVIAVGATLNSHVLQPTVAVNAANAPSNVKGIAAQMGDSFFYPSAYGANAAPLIDVTQLGNDGYACAALPQYSLAGTYALIQQSPSATSCALSTKASNAQTAGAIGIVFYMSSTAAPVNPEGVDQFIGPVVMISNGDGQTLKSYIDANPGQTVTIDTAGREQELAAFSQEYNFTPPLLANQLASYSSFGPTPDGAIKPDVVATGGFDGNQIPDLNDMNLPAPAGLYVAAQNYDPNGEVFSTNRYAAVNGTSFSSPITAGAAALAKQNHPNLTPTQIKSALVNSAAQSVTTDSFGDPVDVEWLGGGLIDAGAAAGATITAEPATISFGYLKSGVLPITKAITITNKGSGAVNLAVAVVSNKQAAGVTVGVNQQSLTLAGGAAATLNVMLSGTVPAAGEYSGAVTLKGSNMSLQLPYMFLVGDGVPYSVTSLGGTSYEGAPGQDAGSIWIQVVDQYGVPVTGTPVSFSIAPAGSVSLASVSGEPACSPNNATTTTSCATDNYGIAWAELTLGSQAASPTVTARAAGTRIPIDVSILPAPAITATGVVNDATFQGPIAPGSYIAIFGSNLVNPSELSNSTGDSATLTTTNALPLMIDGTTVSFDVPSAGISVPGYLTFVSPGQVNVQVPWELENQTTAQVKVTVDEGLFGNVVTVPLQNYTPALFETSTGVAAALDQNNHVIGSSNPVARGQVAQLYVNGLGPVTNTPASGNPATSTLSTTTAQPVVTIGGQNAAVSFSGLAPGFPGLYQINVTVPSSVSTGNQPITVAIGGQTSKASGIFVQ